MRLKGSISTGQLAGIFTISCRHSLFANHSWASRC